MEEEIYLKDFEDFVKIDNLHYGGNQAWLFSENRISEFWANRSCGLIAVTNTLCYLFRKQYPSITKKSYIAFAMELQPFIKPRVYGIPTLGIMVKGLKKYAAWKRYKLTPISLIKPNNITTVIIYIKNALQQDCPVLMLTFNTKTEALKYHWVTITGYYQTSWGGNFLITSNYGKQEIYSLDEWVKGKSFYKGLLWFKLKGQENDCL